MGKNRILMLVWLIFLFAWGALCRDVKAEDVDCETCHKEVVDRDMDKRYVHLPFVRKECVSCHVAGEEVVLPSSLQATATSLDETVPQKIRWFRDAYGVAVSYNFV